MPYLRLLVCLLALLVFGSRSVYGQDAAPYAGTWVMDAARSESAHQSTPIGPVTVVIKHNPQWLLIETRRAGTTQSVVYALDGTDNFNVLESEVAVSKLRWDAGRLVTDTAFTVRGAPITLSALRSLSPDGAEMTVESNMKIEHGYQGTNAPAASKAKDVFVRQKPEQPSPANRP